MCKLIKFIILFVSVKFLYYFGIGGFEWSEIENY